ncbi:VanW family protein [Paenibacillus sp. HN-1]|uniref:VanW family protein n=1 Tax=Paenibacillus TaxID=44249 RepID=UPI001CA973E6|nr:MULTISPECIES: VanW family protein [Paenibacillus]MBY9077562.1 VanW family protein [Paenibacillus sp. CGMCC 1.18879]MBY9087833.1 VanW family protein [Paenibacillus sinensis]
MRKVHAVLIIAGGLLLAVALAYGGVALYAGQSTVPKGTLLAGWDIGGKNIAAAWTELDQKLAGLGAIPLTLRVGDTKGLKLTLKEAGVTYQAKSFLNELDRLSEGGIWERAKARYSFEKNWALTAAWTDTALRSRLNADWESSTFGDPVDATRRITEYDQIVYTPGRTSLRIDWTHAGLTLRAVIPKDFTQLDALKTTGLTAELPLRTVQPDVTLQSLKEQGVARKIMEFSTSLGASGPGRSYNVESAAKAVNDTLLPPGAVFDYDKAIEKAENEYGFREAPVIVNGTLQPGVGGGICQVSSTLYNAALRTGMEIVERRNHSLPVNYLPKGQDATFSRGSINFRFRNTTGHYLLIRAAVSGRSLTVKLFGTFPSNVSYSVESRTVEILAPGRRTVTDSSLPPGASRTLRKGRAGYIVETYQTKFVGGEAVERIRVSRDTYQPKQALVAVGPGGADSSGAQNSERPLVEDGIRSSE